jgi:hypothetical protein
MWSTILTMKKTNQLVVLSGILVILATATIAASNIVQPAKAQSYGQDVIKPNAQSGTWGSQVSAGAQDPNTAHNGLGDYRANGDKYDPSTGQNYVGPGNNGKGGPNFR